MPMLMTQLRSAAIGALTCTTPFSATAEEFEILMLNAAPDILHFHPGDTVTFIPLKRGHNTASKRGMIPEGAKPWNSSLDEKFSITMMISGIYGYVCLPHYEMGMVGLIIVGEGMQNLAKAKGARQGGSARRAFRDLFAQLEGNQ